MTKPFANTALLINPTMADSCWTPEPFQLINWPNPSRANSLWLGLVAPWVMLPGRLWSEVLRPLMYGMPLAALLYLFWFIPMTTLIWIYWGVRGDLFALDVDLATMTNSRMMTPDESLQAMAAGLDDVVVPMSKMPRP